MIKRMLRISACCRSAYKGIGLVNVVNNKLIKIVGSRHANYTIRQWFIYGLNLWVKCSGGYKIFVKWCTFKVDQ